MPLITIKICTDGDRFQGRARNIELSEVLDTLSFIIFNGNDLKKIPKNLKDSNGSPCGTVEVREEGES